jgi:CTP:molybdopterin cytidylyltransferase MocA
MGRDKALEPAGRESFLVRAVLRLWGVCDHVVVVLGSHHAEIQRRAETEFGALVGRRALERLLSRPRARGLDVHFLVNRLWRRGMLSSARVGLGHALTLRPECLMLMPVDHPGVRASTIARLADRAGERRARRRTGASLRAVIPRHRSRRGHPVALSAALAVRILADPDAADLSDAIRRNAARVEYLDVSDPGVIRNRNHPGD